MKNKIVIITGGSSGIGATTALMFAKQGANIIFTYKENKKGAEEIKNKIKDFGVKVLATQADLTIESEAKRVINETIREFGHIDILVNNAGRYIDGDEWNGSSEIWIKSLQQNLVSVMSVSKYAIEIFQKQKSGVMINISSRYSKDGQFDSISYAAAKAGVANITQAYAKLLSPFGRANSVSPSATKVGYWLTAPKEELEKKENRLIEPEKVAEQILALASDNCTINGQNIFVDFNSNLIK
ncbi:MAG: SDR family NAD(P)-dependent oxidoreductase [Candidatus Taylorbacteria bacterium]|nr:SDR family NAD(P)-dependent oxidoreductase [Candidatus Taylorbacteria bacterium]